MMFPGKQQRGQKTKKVVANDKKCIKRMMKNENVMLRLTHRKRMIKVRCGKEKLT